MNYAELFRLTLPETALEVAALASSGCRSGPAAQVCIACARGGGCDARRDWMRRGDPGLAVQMQGGLGYAGSDDLLLAVGGSTAVAQVGILVLTALTLFLLIDSDFTRHVGEFVAVVLMAATGGLVIAAAQDLLVIFIGLELLSLGLYILTAFAKRSGKSAEAAIKYYLFGGMSAAFLLFGFSYLYGIAGSTNLHRIMLAMYGPNAFHAAPLVYVAAVMIAAGLGFKVAAAPFHLWAPDTYEGAPSSGAAFIASVSKVASFALLISIGTAAWHVFDGSHLIAHAEVQVGLTPAPPVYLGFRWVWT